MRYSIITVNYNNCSGLRNTIKSVVEQTYSDYEYIIIDGGSTDGSVELIKEYEKFISFWISEKDKGIYHAMNKGVAQAHGDYSIFINSGDFFYNEKVLLEMSELNFQEDIVVGKVVIDDKGTIISPPPEGELTLYHLYSGAIPHQGSFIRTDLLRRYPYDESLKISSDWKFFIETLIVANHSLRYVDKYVSQYDLGGISSKNPKQMRDEKEKVLLEFFPPRILADYKKMKESECLTQILTPMLRDNYRVDKLLFTIGSFLLKMKNRLL